MSSDDKPDEDKLTDKFMEEQWVDEFLAHLETERRLSPHTISNYRRDLKGVVEYCKLAGIADWKSLDAQHIRSWVAKRHRQGIGGRSLARALSALRSFLHYLMRENRLKVNVAKGIRAPKSSRKLPEPLDADEMARLLSVSDDNPLAIRDLAMLELMYSSGLRLAELVSLNLGDVDLADGSVPVTGKGGKARIVPVGQYAHDALQRAVCIRISCVMHLPVICWNPVETYEQYKNCWVTRIFQPPRFIPISIFSISLMSTTRPTPGQGRNKQEKVALRKSLSGLQM